VQAPRAARDAQAAQAATSRTAATRGDDRPLTPGVAPSGPHVSGMGSGLAGVRPRTRCSTSGRPDWGAIRRVTKGNLIERLASIQTADPVKPSWLIEAALRSYGRAMALATMQSTTELYPFSFVQPLGYAGLKSTTLEQMWLRSFEHEPGVRQVDRLLAGAACDERTTDAVGIPGFTLRPPAINGRHGSASSVRCELTPWRRLSGHRSPKRSHANRQDPVVMASSVPASRLDTSNTKKPEGDKSGLYHWRFT